jgi:hypothetical protein
VRLTLNGVQRTLLIIWVQIAQGLANHQTQFNFIVQAHALGAQDRSGAGGEDRGGGLEEEEGLLGGCVVEFGDVIAKSIHLVSNCRRTRDVTFNAAVGAL